MKRALGILTSITVWAMLAALAGQQYGYEQGYRRGVRDIGKLIMHWRDANEPPSPFTKGEI